MLRNILAWLIGLPRIVVEVADEYGRVLASRRVFWVTREAEGRMYMVPLHQPVVFSASEMPLEGPVTVAEARVFAFGKRRFYREPIDIVLTHPSDQLVLTIKVEVPGGVLTGEDADE